MKIGASLVIGSMMAIAILAAPITVTAQTKATRPSVEMSIQSEQAFRKGLDAYNARRFGKAMRIWLPIAGKGNAKAQSSIGYLYFKGLDVTQSDQKARSWYAIAAVQGEPTAQYHMGQVYLRGKAVKRNPAEAYMWCDLAMNGGFPDGVYCRDDASRDLSPAEIQKAEERGRQLIGGAKS